MTNSQFRINLATWKFVLPFFLQLGIILLVPAKSAYTYYTGQTAIVQTAPVDPYDLLRGYSQTLSYEISDVAEIRKLSEGVGLTVNSIFYLILEANPEPDRTPPLPWKAIAVSSDFPQNLLPNQIALKGKVKNYRTAIYGLETYYMPEQQRNQINREIRDLQRDSRERVPVVVEIKIDRWGNSVPVSLWIGEQKYRF